MKQFAYNWHALPCCHCTDTVCVCVSIYVIFSHISISGLVPSVMSIEKHPSEKRLDPACRTPGLPPPSTAWAVDVASLDGSDMLGKCQCIENWKPGCIDHSCMYRREQCAVDCDYIYGSKHKQCTAPAASLVCTRRLKNVETCTPGHDQ